VLKKLAVATLACLTVFLSKRAMLDAPVERTVVAAQVQTAQ
jgi:hypothetical protein